ncbi:MAG: hypothetical protein KJ930_11620, partial [Gammaproteobacteria bacterium]|nr:hypothetical protein [Gammaproteobacteria bacterium]
MKANLTWAYRLLVLAFLLIVFLRCEFAQSEQRSSLFALGQRYFESVGNEESIPGDVVTALAQDKSGFLWIGT